jgi:hypothetical protein
MLSELYSLNLKLYSKQFNKNFLLHLIAAPQLSSSLRHNYSAKTRLTGCTNEWSLYSLMSMMKTFLNKGAFTLANFARDFALSLHVLLNKNYLLSLLNVQASAKSRAKSRQCKCTLKNIFCHHYCIL